MTPVTAQCILRAPDGASILDAPEPVTAESAERYVPSPETVEEASRRLAKLGFDVTGTGVTLTISADEELFEQVFRTTLERATPPGAGGESWRAATTVTIPEDLAHLIAAVVFPIEPIYHAMGSAGGGGA